VSPPAEIVKAGALFVLTAVAEIVGCFLPFIWLRRSGSPWLLLPGAASLALFAWLLSLHPTSAGRTYAAYGGVYITTAMLWLWMAERQVPTRWDLVGASLCVAGSAIIVLGSR
jgi:small multidrug resistance family-3 protein